MTIGFGSRDDYFSAPEMPVEEALIVSAKGTIDLINKLRSEARDLRRENERLNERLSAAEDRMNESKCNRIVEDMEIILKHVKEINAGQAETIASLVAERKMWKAKIKLEELKDGSHG